MIPEIRIENFDYDLPDGRIAKYPLEERDASKLLVRKRNNIIDALFYDIPSFLPEGALMIFNDTKVVPARLFFRRDTGAHIEIFCLEPVSPAEYNQSFASTDSCSWKCVIGNSKRWKGDIIHYDAPADSPLSSMQLSARLLDREGQTGIVQFSWQGGESFSRVLELCGRVPIPPYLNRETEALDLERYQTLYAHIRGSVAAPTAGLHFTERVLEQIRAKGIDTETVCLHVGAGTFLPVKSSLVSEHPMHREPFVVERRILQKLIARLEARESGKNGTIVAVGTTSVRTLESLYYAGVSCLEGGEPQDVGQWAPYEREFSYSTLESLRAIDSYLEASGLEELKLGTRIIIVPGFNFRLVDAIVTNFHQPQSTLLLLISAFVNGDWHSIYDHALANDYRFLSYGDSSLLFRG